MYFGTNTLVRRPRRLGDAFDDLLSSVGSDFDSSLSVPALSDSGSIISSPTSLTSTADLSSLITTMPGLDDGTALTQLNPATSDSSWQSILNGVSKIAPSITNAYTATQTVAAQQALAKAQIAALPASASSVLSSLTTSPYFSYFAIGGFALLALSVLGGSSSGGSKRRR